MSNLIFTSNTLPSQGWQDPFLLYPRDIVFKVLQFFTRKDLFRMMRVCKQWKSLAMQGFLWQNDFVQLGLKPSSLEALSDHVKGLLESARKGEALLEGPENDQSQNQHELERAFYATLSLYKLGLRSFDQLEKYAVAMESYGSDKGWHFILLELIENNQIGSAMKIIESHSLRQSAEFYMKKMKMKLLTSG